MNANIETGCGFMNPSAERTSRNFFLLVPAVCVSGTVNLVLAWGLWVAFPAVLHAGPRVKNENTLTVVTYNLWHGLNPTSAFKFQEYESEIEREKRLHGFLQIVRKLDPDIVFLQEVNPAPGKTRRVASALGYDSVYQIDNAGLKIFSLGLPTNLRSGLAILARKELGLKKLGARKLSGSPGGCSRVASFQLHEFRYALAAGVHVQGTDLLLINTHLHHGLAANPELKAALEQLVIQGKITREKEKEVLEKTRQAPVRRQKELETAVRFARTLGADRHPMIFAGDFNATPGAPELVWLTREIGFVSVTRDDDPEQVLMTWDTKRNPNTQFIANFKPPTEFASFIMEHMRPIVLQQSRRLDYIFFRPAGDFLRVGEAGLFGDEAQDGRMCSDHFGIYAVFRLKKNSRSVDR
jgi:endonuclease/exonuclease/phosphatase family metal-dependent hydrolase